MPTSDDRRAAAVLLALAVLGLAVRWLAGPGAPGEVAFRAPPPEPAARARVAAEATRLARPLGPNERVDLDRAPAAELARLPRIGPGLAERIVAYRERHGPFGSLEALREMPGVGDGTIAALRPHARFSAPARPSPAVPARARSMGAALLLSPSSPSPARARPIHVNSATVAELETLPGIGPSLAARILADRKAHGAYGRPEDLLRVAGIGPATLARLKARIAIP
ncbi:MAG TPA: ComEA family DNA-binding protein [Gemmatimonadales bacterium]|nr:ComEA family DNA-binding protein [Gemmatimonadales bacterium]